MPRRKLSDLAGVLLRDNIRALITARGLTQTALAQHCNHEPAWMSKILAGERALMMEDLGPIADFFGVEISALFRPGISFLTERRSGADRRHGDRRSGQERRVRGVGSTVRLGSPDGTAVPVSGNGMQRNHRFD